MKKTTRKFLRKSIRSIQSKLYSRLSATEHEVLKYVTDYLLRGKKP